MSRKSIARRELIRKHFSSNTVDSKDIVTVGNGCISSLDRPKRLRECANSGRRVEDDLSPVHTKHHPIEWMVSTVADIDGYLSKLGLEDWMAVVSLHVIGTLVEITNARNAFLSRLRDQIR